ncbi:MAG: TRAP transporter TatT component family protein [Bacteroidota bacterium]
MLQKSWYIFPFLLLFAGCSIQKLAIRSVGGVMDYGFEAMNEETDLPLAEQGLASNLKLIDALIKGDPENDHLLFIGVQGYSSYALGFVEDQSPARAKVFYARSRDYAFRILDQNKEFATARNGTLDDFTAALGSFSKDAVPAIFWGASAWGSLVKLSIDDPEILIDLPKVLAMMDFVIKNDSTYYNGFAFAFYGTIDAVTPKMLGGKPDRAKQYFERCLAINGGKFLLSYVFYAQYYAVGIADQELFESLLKKVEVAPDNILPEQNLANMIAKQKAKALLAKTSELF